MKYTEDMAVMAIRYFNMQAGTAFRTKNEGNLNIVKSALDKVEDIRTLNNHIRDYCIAHKDETITGGSFAECFYSIKAEEPEVEAPAPAPVNVAPTETAVASSLGLLERAVVQMVSTMKADEITAEIMGSVESKVRDFIKSEYGTIEKKIVTVIDGKEFKPDGVCHEKFDTVVKFVANNEPVMLVGPAGSGKNELCKQVAKALDLPFYFTNAVTQEYKLTGFTDAMGNYQETQFYRAFTEGGLFMLDEIDASIPEVLVILNAAIANRYFDFPAPIGYVEAHPNFRVVAAGNTWGHGADFSYVGRNQLDAASLDRFAVVKIDYSEAIERACARDNAELLDFCRAYRKGAEMAGVNVVVSYRAIKRLATMIEIMDVKEALETCLVKGLEADDIRAILSNIENANTYTKALAKLMEG